MPENLFQAAFRSHPINIKKWIGFAALAFLLLFGCYKVWFKIYTSSQNDEVLEAVVRQEIRPNAKAIIFFP